MYLLPLLQKIIWSISLLIISLDTTAQDNPLKIGVIGLTHTHVHWIFGSDQERDEIEIVGIVEPNENLARKYADQYNFPLNRVYNSMEELFTQQKVEAVAAFGTIYDHLEIVEAAAPKGIHVMVEKPLAISKKHAMKMGALAEKHNIHLLTNYETSWYPTNHKAYELVAQAIIGDLRKVIVNDGHRGPKKIGVDTEFLEWLTDPELNGGGAITDFGCYGANLITWLRSGEKPKSVTAITKQLQRENNPHVDDEAIIVLEYTDMVGVIQASWNWPMGRKDMEIYGLKGAIYADNRNDLRVRIAKGYDGFEEEKMSLSERARPYDDPFAYLAGVVREQISLKPYDLSSLENNLIVMEILDAARKSAKTGKRVQLK